MTATAKKAPVKRAPPKPKTETPSVKVPSKKPAAKKAPAKPKPKTKTVAKPRVKKPMGRPALYSLELGERLCGELAMGVSMKTACLPDDMPSAATVFGWMRKHPEFLDIYTRAKAEAADALVEEMLDISDDGTNDWMETRDKDGNDTGYKINGEHVTRSRLRVETRKWIAAKLKPKKYGEKVDVSHGVQADNPITALMGQMAGKVLKPVAEHEGARHDWVAFPEKRRITLRDWSKP